MVVEEREREREREKERARCNGGGETQMLFRSGRRRTQHIHDEKVINFRFRN